MNDRPTMAELVSAAKLYLEGELIPTLTDARLRFQTLVAANVLAIVERELEHEEDHLSDEWQSLAEILGQPGQAPERQSALREMVRQGNRQLCEGIRAGKFDEPARFRALSALVRRQVERKLEIANPRYLAATRNG
ncbi:MAG TPA: DUF6285 domain-containing protein [Gemmataceae bacterium]|nr:DUF6285 domain-containing protein [Gemmataceae bacterium]